ncbi:MAG: discoidin domain-containing protein [Kiritimatiellae bacterium]|nr:discoidin domain-containing protein [Kiritimatiellia bacterium]
MEKKFPIIGKIREIFSNGWKAFRAAGWGLLGLLLAGCAGAVNPLAVPEAARWTVTASSQQEGHPPAFAADGDDATEWLAAPSDTQPWWQADLGRNVPVCGFSVDWGPTPAASYTLSVSTDAEHWTVVSEVEDGDGGWDVMQTTPLRARHVRLAITRREQGAPAALRSVEVFGIWTRPEVLAGGKPCPEGPSLLQATPAERGWRCAGPDGELVVDFRAERSIGGVRAEWGPGGWAAFTKVEVSADGETWHTIGHGRSGGRATTVLGKSTRARWVRIAFRGGSGPEEGTAAADRGLSPTGFELRQLAFRGSEGSLSPWTRLQEAAAAAPDGHYPMVLRGDQVHWTAAGIFGASLSEEGAFSGEPDQPALWPYVVEPGGALRTPCSPEAHPEYSLGARGAGPLPEIRWEAGGGLSVRQRAMSRTDVPGAWELIEVSNRSGEPRQGRLCLVMHPLAVAPPWSGIPSAPVQDVRFPDVKDPRAPRALSVNRTTLYSLLAEDGPLAVGAAPFTDGGDAVRYLPSARWPTNASVQRTDGLVSAVCGISFNLAPGGRTRLLAWTGRAPAPPPEGEAPSPFPDFEAAWDEARLDWSDHTRGLDPRIDRPDAMEALRAQSGWLQCLPAPTVSEPLQTVAMRTAALLRAGAPGPARLCLGAVAAAVGTNGLPPSALLASGQADPAAVPLPPGEAEGLFAFMLLETHRFTGDTALLTEMYPTLRLVLQRLSRLREDERRRAASASGLLARTRRTLPLGPGAGPHEGLLPPDSSGRHPYAALLWALNAWREGAAAAGILGRDEDAAWMADEYRQLRASLRTSLRTSIDAMPAPGIPDSPERPVPSLPAALLLSWPCSDPSLAESWEIQSTLDGHYAAFLDRLDATNAPASAAAEPLLSIPYARLGRGDYAREFLAQRLECRTPLRWHTWPDSVSPDPRRRDPSGNMPDTLAAAAYLIAVRTLIADERGNRLDLLQGPPMEWLQYGDGLRVEHMPTQFGALDLAARWSEDRFTATIGGDARPPSGYRLRWPMTGLPDRVTLNGATWQDYDSTACNLPHDFQGTVEATLPYLAPWPREP